jgi:hypothetical protein
MVELHWYLLMTENFYINRTGGVKGNHLTLLLKIPARSSHHLWKVANQQNTVVIPITPGQWYLRLKK